MIYVMSDIHGCYDKYHAMLEKINFSEEDILYILGDIVDRGPKGIKVLLESNSSSNIVLCRGNHDQKAWYLLSNIQDILSENVSKEMLEMYEEWVSDGGQSTLEEYLQLSKNEQEQVLKIIQDTLFYKEIIVNGTTYFMAHTVPEKELLLDRKNCSLEYFLLGEPDYEIQYFKEKIIITGHTPTGFIDSTSDGKIWKRNNHIAVDCGAVFGKALGCICLDTQKEFYV